LHRQEGSRGGEIIGVRDPNGAHESWADYMSASHAQNEHLDELQKLLAAVVFDDASDEQLDRLNDLLKADVELRRSASQFLEEECVLRRQFEMLGRVADYHQLPLGVPSDAKVGMIEQLTVSGNADRKCTDKSKGGATRSAALAIFFAASILFVLGAPMLWTNGRRPVESTDVALNRPEGATSDEVGLFIQGQFADWHDASHITNKEPLRVGDVITAVDGVLNLRFYCGAEVLLKGPAELKVLSPMRAVLRRGTLTAHVEESAHGFRIDTPSSKVTDLGTEFGLSVDAQGATDAIVFSGKVALQYAQPRADGGSAARSSASRRTARQMTEGRLLIEGEGMRIAQSGGAKRLVAVKSSDYPRPGDSREAPAGSTPVIESVADNLRDGDTTMCYRIVHHGFDEDARAYVDRPYQWNGLNSEFGLPQFLRNADYVMPFCDDKLSKQLEVRLGIGRPARVYVLIDDRVELPQWLVDGFQDTGYDVGVDESATAASWLSLGSGSGVSVDKCFSVWFRDVTEASTLALGSMKSPTIQSLMYCVAAIPLNVAAATEPGVIRHYQPQIGSGLIRKDLLPVPIAEAQIERVDGFADLNLARPSADDAGSREKEIAFRVESNDGKYLPHKQVVVDGGTLPRLNDGQVARNSDDLDQNVWYDGQGRFSVDLLKPTQIAAINTFSWHTFERAPQFFTVWGSKAAQKPSTTFVEAEHATAAGWELVGFVKTGHLGDGGVHASSLRRSDGSLGPYRHLLWIAENTVRSTFFTEIDIHAAAE